VLWITVLINLALPAKENFLSIQPSTLDLHLLIGGVKYLDLGSGRPRYLPGRVLTHTPRIEATILFLQLLLKKALLFAPLTIRPVFDASKEEPLLKTSQLYQKLQFINK